MLEEASVNGVMSPLPHALATLNNVWILAMEGDWKGRSAVGARMTSSEKALMISFKRGLRSKERKGRGGRFTLTPQDAVVQ